MTYPNALRHPKADKMAQWIKAVAVKERKLDLNYMPGIFQKAA